MAGLKGLKKKRRVQLIIAAFVGLALTTTFAVYGLQKGINYFRSPSEVMSDPPTAGEVFRIGGLVKAGSIVMGQGVQFNFVITDTNVDVPVAYVGNNVRPDLFAEGKGAVATGSMKDGVFQATEILAKHDENYMPKEVVDALKAQGVYVAPAK